MAVSFEVLGFAGAAPLQGACSSYLVGDGRTTLLLDCGPGTLERLWRRDLLGRLDAIVLSHMHADHMLDLLMLAGELGRSLMAPRRPILHVPAGDGRDVLRRLDAVFAREQDLPTRFEEAFDVREHGVEDRLRYGGLELSFAASAHPQPCFGVRVSDGTTTIVYGADGSPSAPIEALASEADLLVLEATLPDELGPHAGEQGHMTAAQAGALAARAKASRLLLTHTIAGVDGERLRAGAARSFTGAVELAREGYVFVG